MGWFRDTLKFVGEVGGTVAAVVPAMAVEAVSGAVALGQDLTGNTRAAARTRARGDEMVGNILEGCMEFGGSVGGTAGDVVEAPVNFMATRGNPKYAKQRKLAMKNIVLVSLGNSGVSAVPTPGLEAHKHVALGAAEIGLCVMIAHIYFEKKFTEGRIKELLVENGLAVGTGTGLAFAATKVGHGLVHEALNFVPVVGPGIKAAVAGSVTFSLGLAFCLVCENRLDSGRPL